MSSENIPQPPDASESRADTRQRELQHFKNEFLANVSHEMRTPLSVIMGYVQILKEETLGPLTDAQKKAMDTILSRAGDLLRVLTHVLRAREIQEGKSQLRLTAVELRDFLAQRLEKPYRDRSRKKIDIRKSFPEREAWVRADSQRLGEVLDNILLNAFKFGPEASTVWVEVLVKGKEAVVSVRDEGPGLAPERRERVFEPFSATVQGLTREYGGLGLGLFLCREVLELHGGRIWLGASKAGSGCVASFSLPLAAPPAGSAAAPAPEKKRVLVVEDDLDLTQLLVIFLSKMGDSVEVATAESGIEAVRMAKEKPPHLVILDLLLPGMDGFAVIEALRKEPATAGVSILVMTGYEKGMEQVSRSANQDVIMKPFDEATFAARVRQMLGRLSRT